MTLGADMDEDRKRRLQERGWKVGSAADFLELTPEEAAYIELKLALSESVRQRRHRQGLTQGQVAQKMGSSQSRVAKIEGADPTVSIDLLVRALLALGANKSDIGQAIEGTPARKAS